MTCIAGAVKNGEICIGGDAISLSRDQNVRVGTAGKVFRVGELLIGASGTIRTNQIIRYLFDPPPVDGDLFAYMVRGVVPVLREIMKENGAEYTTSSNTVEMVGRYLIGLRGRLFFVDGGYGVFESRDPYAAVGCADQEALAGMFTAFRLDANASAQEIVESGLLAAAELDINIRPPFTVLALTESDWLCPRLSAGKSNGEFKTTS